MPEDNEDTNIPLPQAFSIEARMFILNKSGTPVRIKDKLRWDMWRTLTNTRIAVSPVGPVVVSTAFMALDHQLVDGLDPILWETRVLADSGTAHLAGFVRHCGGNQAGDKSYEFTVFSYTEDDPKHPNGRPFKVTATTFIARRPL